MEKEHRLKLVSLNIELDRHLDKVLPFLQQERADVICLQEVCEKNFATLERGLHMTGFFVPTCVPDVERVVDKRAAGEGRLVVNEELVKKGPEGIALFTGLPVHSTHIDYYHKISEAVPRWSVGQNRVLFSAIVDKGGKNYTVGTTHFTWTPDGKGSPEQERDMKKLLEILARFPGIVFCGDFNAPRGGEMWAKFAEKYADNIPNQYNSSLDPKLHRAGHLDRMVDGLFCTPEYIVSNVRLVEGVSDHKAVVGMIERII